jgi:ribosome-associated protein
MTEDTALERVLICARVAAERRATDPVILDVRGLSSVTDYLLIVTGSSDRRVQTIAEAIVQVMKESGVRPVGVEGLREGRWVLADFGEWVIHVFQEEPRAFYDLEGLWFDAKRIEPPAQASSGSDRIVQRWRP